LSGGEIFVTSGLDLKPIMEQALRSLRTPYEPPTAISGSLHRASTRRSGMTITATWHKAEDRKTDLPHARAVAAIAASIALPALSIEAAVALAEAEGLVTHLTSLVLVDETSATQETMPMTRKIPLPSPRTATMPVVRAFKRAAMPPAAAAAAPSRAMMRMRQRPIFYFTSALYYFPESRPTHDDLLSVAYDIDWDRLVELIDWDNLTADLERADWSRLPADLVIWATKTPEVVALANKLDLFPAIVVVALMAQTASKYSRSAARIARTLLVGISRKEIGVATKRLGLKLKSASSKHGDNSIFD
jgi:hypothetical protein